jgi:hypothetical protein
MAFRCACPTLSTLCISALHCVDAFYDPVRRVLGGTRRSGLAARV